MAIKSARAGVSVGTAMGDPGLFGFLGKAVKGITGLVSKALPGPIGAAAGAVSRVLPGTGRGTPRVVSARQAGVSPMLGRTAALGGAGLVAGTLGGAFGGNGRCGPGQVRVGNRCVSPGDVFPGGAPFISPAGPAAGTQIACPSGFHPNKQSYRLKDGTFVPKGSKCVKNRRRNPLNPRALDRAISRVSSAKRASKKLSRITVRKAKTC